VRRSPLSVALGVACALLAACSNDDSPVRAEAPTATAAARDHPAVGDHWHLAIGFNRCGKWLDPQRDVAGDQKGVHTHDDGLIHLHPFFNEVSGDNATLKWFLEDIGAVVDEDGLTLATGEVLPFNGECEGEPARLRVARWTSAQGGLGFSGPVNADLLRNEPLRPDGAVIAIAFTADEQIDQPPSVADLAEPSDITTATVGPRVPGSIPDPANVLSFAPVLWTGPAPCSETAVLDEKDECFELGPVSMDQDSVESAEAVSDLGRWSVSIVLTEAGMERFNMAAAACFQRELSCPTGQLAVVFRGQVMSAPTIQAPRFERDQIQISGDFTQKEARELALAISG
jgi:hypothetical protein